MHENKKNLQLIKNSKSEAILMNHIVVIALIQIKVRLGIVCFRVEINLKVVFLYTCSFISFRLYLNGDGDGKNTHVSIFFVIMRSEYDHLLEWPFSRKVTFRLIHPMDDSFSIRESFQPDRSSVSFQKPKREMNIAAGCPQFIAKDELHVRNFLIDDSIFIETIVGDGMTIKN